MSQITNGDRERLVSILDTNRQYGNGGAGDGPEYYNSAHVRAVVAAVERAIGRSECGVAWVKSRVLAAECGSASEADFSPDIVGRVLAGIESRSVRRCASLEPGEAERLTGGLRVTQWSKRRDGSTWRVERIGESGGESA